MNPSTFQGGVNCEAGCVSLSPNVRRLPEVFNPHPWTRVATIQEGRLLLEFLLAQGPTQLSKINVQRLAPRGAMPGPFPRWLVQDLTLCTAVEENKRIVIGQASTTDERIAPFMTGRD